MYLPFAETETLTMKLMKRRILQVCLTCHWASEKIVIGRRNNMLVRINFYFFLPNSSLNVMFFQSKYWWSNKTESCRPSPPPPTATRWTATAATTPTTPPTTSSPATPGGTRTTPTPPQPRHRSSPSERGRTRSWRGPRGSPSTSPSTTSSTFPWVRRYFFPSTDIWFDIHHPEEFTEALDRHKLKGMTEEQVTIAKDIR